jgi:hypothetical protein
MSSPGIFVSMDDLTLMRDAISLGRNLGQSRDVTMMIEHQLEHIPHTPYTKAMQNALDRAEGLYREAAATEYDRMMEEPEEEDGDDNEVNEDE